MKNNFPIFRNTTQCLGWLLTGCCCSFVVRSTLKLCGIITLSEILLTCVEGCTYNLRVIYILNIVGKAQCCYSKALLYSIIQCYLRSCTTDISDDESKDVFCDPLWTTIITVLVFDMKIILSNVNS